MPALVMRSWTLRRTGVSRTGSVAMRVGTARSAAMAWFRWLRMLLVADFGAAVASCDDLAVMRAQFASHARRSG